MPLPFEHRVAIVTGARHGIGRAITVAFVQAGGSVLAVDSSLEGMDETTRQAGGATPSRVAVLEEDVSQAGAGDRIVGECIDRFGTLDCLVNNAVRQMHTPLASVDAALWDELTAISLRATALLARAAAPHLSRAGGSIVNISSAQALGATADNSVYVAAKAGLLGLTRALAVDLGPQGVRVNAICPGRIWIFDDDPTDDVDVELAAYALGRFGRPEEVASVALFLASDASSFMTGTSIDVDGGMAAMSPTQAAINARR